MLRTSPSGAGSRFRHLLRGSRVAPRPSRCWPFHACTWSLCGGGGAGLVGVSGCGCAERKWVLGAGRGNLRARCWAESGDGGGVDAQGCPAGADSTIGAAGVRDSSAAALEAALLDPARPKNTVPRFRGQTTSQRHLSPGCSTSPRTAVAGFRDKCRRLPALPATIGAQSQSRWCRESYDQ